MPMGKKSSGSSTPILWNSEIEPMRHISRIAALLCVLVGARGASYSQSSSPIQFMGSTRLMSQISNRQGTNQDLPPSFLRWDLNSIVNVYGLPISVNALFSTEQQGAYQNINYFNVGLSRADLQQTIREKIDERIGALEGLRENVEGLTPAALADSVKKIGGEALGTVDPDEAINTLQELRDLKEGDMAQRMEQLESLGLASAVQSFTSVLSTFSLGVTFPAYTRLTLDGVPVTGLNVEVTPGMFYFAVAGGIAQEATPNLNSFNSYAEIGSFKRSLAATRFGVGGKDDTHFYISGLYGKDDEGSLTRDSLNNIIAPQKNVVLGADGRLLLLDDRLDLSAEYTYSVLTADIQAPGPAESDVPGVLGNLVDANSTTSGDVAYNVAAAYSIVESGTKLSGFVRRVGAGYTSMGAPYLRQDNMRYEAKVDQSLMNRQLSIGAFYRRDEDNLSNIKGTETTVNSFGAQLGVNFRDYPYLRLSYAPLSQVSQVFRDSLKIENDILIASALAGYIYRASSGFYSSTAISFMYSEGKTEMPGASYLSRNAMLMQTFGFASPLLVNFSIGTINSELGEMKTQIVNTDFSVSYTFYDVWQNTAGVSLSRDAVRRNGIYVRSSAPLWTKSNLEVTAERSMYEDQTFDFDETLVRLTLSQSW